MIQNHYSTPSKLGEITSRTASNSSTSEQIVQNQTNAKLHSIHYVNGYRMGLLYPTNSVDAILQTGFDEGYNVGFKRGLHDGMGEYSFSL